MYIYIVLWYQCYMFSYACTLQIQHYHCSMSKIENATTFITLLVSNNTGETSM